MIIVENILKSYNNQEVIRIPLLKFEDQKSYMIHGPSGRGKTTLLNIIAGVVPVNSGTVKINDKNITDMTTTQRDDYRLNQVGYVFQDFKLLGGMTVKDNLELLSVGRKGRIPYQEYLHKVGLHHKEHQKVATLSGGEKQRLAICRAIAKKPPILLADEPTGNLNQAIAKETMQLLVNLSKEIGAVLIVVSHDMEMLSFFDYSISMESINEVM